MGNWVLECGKVAQTLTVAVCVEVCVAACVAVCVIMCWRVRMLACGNVAQKVSAMSSIHAALKCRAAARADSFE